MWLIPVDLGQVSDWTAVAAVRVGGDHPRRTCFVAGLDRMKGEPYPRMVDKIGAAAGRFPDAALVVDMGGVGRAVIDQLRHALPGRRVWGVTLTHGQRVTPGQHMFDVNVPKKDVVTSAQVMLQDRRLTYSRDLRLAKLL
jgi:hypothetical protein